MRLVKHKDFLIVKILELEKAENIIHYLISKDVLFSCSERTIFIEKKRTEKEVLKRISNYIKTNTVK